MGLGSVIAKDIVHYNLYHHHGHLVKEGAIPRAAMAFIWDGTGTKGAQGQVHCLKPGQVYNDHDAGYDLSDDGSQCGPRHPHVEAEDKQRVQYGIEDGAGEGTHHGKTGLPSARIRLEPPVVRIRNGNPRDVIPV